MEGVQQQSLLLPRSVKTIPFAGAVVDHHCSRSALSTSTACIYVMLSDLIADKLNELLCNIAPSWDAIIPCSTVDATSYIDTT